MLPEWSKGNDLRSFVLLHAPVQTRHIGVYPLHARRFLPAAETLLHLVAVSLFQCPPARPSGQHGSFSRHHRSAPAYARAHPDKAQCHQGNDYCTPSRPQYDRNGTCTSRMHGRLLVRVTRRAWHRSCGNVFGGRNTFEFKEIYPHTVPEFTCSALQNISHRGNSLDYSSLQTFPTFYLTSLITGSHTGGPCLFRNREIENWK